MCSFFFFISRQYPVIIVDSAINKAFSIDRTTACTHSQDTCRHDRIPFTITFHPVDNSIDLIIKILIYLIFRFEHFEYFQPKPFFLKKENRNLPTFFVKGTLSSDKQTGAFCSSPKQCIHVLIVLFCFAHYIATLSSLFSTHSLRRRTRQFFLQHSFIS